MDVDDRWHRAPRPGQVASLCREHKQVPTARHGKGLRYAARYRDDLGRQRSPGFATVREARNHLAGVRTDLARGTYLDPAAGRVTLRSYAADWLAAQTFDPSTREATELRLRLHVIPVLGETELRGLRPSVVQAWVRGLQAQLAANYVRVVFANLSAILTAAVDDGKVSKNPCAAASVKPPAAVRRRVVPWTGEQVAAVRAALAERYRATVDVAAGCGLRQGEVFGLAVEDVDWLRGV